MRKLGKTNKPACTMYSVDLVHSTIACTIKFQNLPQCTAHYDWLWLIDWFRLFSIVFGFRTHVFFHIDALCISHKVLLAVTHIIPAQQLAPIHQFYKSVTLL